MAGKLWLHFNIRALLIPIFTYKDSDTVNEFGAITSKYHVFAHLAYPEVPKVWVAGINLRGSQKNLLSKVSFFLVKYWIL